MTATRWLETERLRLRPYEAGDLDVMAALYGDPQVTAYTKLGRQDRAQAQAILEGYLRDWRDHGFGLWAVFTKTDQTYIGESGLFLLHGTEPALRYAFLPAQWGQGFAAEAVRATLDACFEDIGLTRILSVVQQRNAASLRLMQKLGFAPVRQDNDGEIALVIHAVERADWIAHAQGTTSETAGSRQA